MARPWCLIPYLFGVIETTVQLQDFDFTLPPESIAQVPAARRDQARLMVVDRAQQRVTHDTFTNIGNYLRAGDVLVVNDTKVIPARLRGRKVGTGGKVEVLLLHELQTGRWEVLLKPAARVRLGMTIEFGAGVLSGRILERCAGGTVVMQFTPVEIYAVLDKCGEVVCTLRLNSWSGSRSRGSHALPSLYTSAGARFNRYARPRSSSTA